MTTELISNITFLAALRVEMKYVYVIHLKVDMLTDAKLYLNYNHTKTIIVA